MKVICLRFLSAGWNLLQDERSLLKNKNQTCDLDPEA